MQPEAVVEHLDKLEDRVKGLRTGWPCDQVNELGFQRCEETLGDGVAPMAGHDAAGRMAVSPRARSSAMSTIFPER